jgi:hypothetical protein
MADADDDFSHTQEGSSHAWEEDWERMGKQKTWPRK